MATMRDFIELSINQQLHRIDGESVFCMLADYLRYEKGLTGTKIVCAEGDCGACSILVRNRHEPVFYPINSCITKVYQLDRCEILTVEGLAKTNELTCVQKSIMNCHGSQCGFCTPGFVITLSAYFEKPRPKKCEQSIKNALTGNLCRCTGYQPFIDAGMKTEVSETLSRLPLVDFGSPSSVHINTPEKSLCISTTMQEALTYLSSNKMPRIWSGSTDLGVQQNKGKLQAKHFLSLQHIDELRTISETSGRIEINALVTIEQVRRFLKSRIKPVSDFLNIFASPQIKYQATLVGNIANGSPIADCWPWLLALNASVHVKSVDKDRTILLEHFFEDYKKSVLLPNEIIKSISFAMPNKHVLVYLKKISTRRDLDIATINAAFVLTCHNDVIEEVRLVFGGVAKTALVLTNTNNLLQGQKFSTELIDRALTTMQKEIAPLSDVRGSSTYRRILADNLLRDFLIEVWHGQSFARNTPEKTLPSP